MRKTILSYLIVALFFMMVGFFYRYHIPQIKTWTVVRIAEISEKYLQAKVMAQDVGISFWPFGVELNEVVIIPRGEVSRQMAPVKAKRLSGGLSLINLLTGKKNLYWFTAVEPQVTVIIKPEKSQAPRNFSLPTKTILNVPVHWLQVKDMTLRLRSDEDKLVSEIRNLNIEIEHDYVPMLINISTPQLNIKKKDLGQGVARVALEARIILEPKILQISNLKIQRRNSAIVGTGLIEGSFENGVINNYSLKGRSRVNLAETKNWILNFFPDLELPSAEGTFDAQFDLQKEKDRQVVATANLQTWGLQINQFKVGQIQTSLAYQDDTVTSKFLELSNPAGKARIENISLDLKDKFPFAADVKVTGLELALLLNQIGLKKPELHLMMQGHLPCKGELKPTPFLTCTGTMNGTDFEVFDIEKNGTKDIIVAAKTFQATGSVIVDKESVRTKADLKVGSSVGKGEGKIDYKKGFQFSFSTPELKMSDVAELAGLGLEGSGELNGTTSGNSDYAVVNLSLKTKDLWLSDYAIGNGASDVSYKAGLLKFENIEGTYRSSRYLGTTTINLKDKTIEGNFRFPFLEAGDLQIGLERKAKLPFSVSGAGTGHVILSGPLVFTQLTYDLQSHINRAVIAGEIFEHAYFNIHARKGHVVADRIELVKGQGNISMVGDGYPDGSISTKTMGKDLLLESFDLFSSLPISFTGNLGFTTEMKGHVLKPTVSTQGSVTQSSISQQNVPDTSFQFQVNANTLQGKGNFFGQTITTDFIYPLKDGQPFKLNLSTIKWNFAPFLAFISGNARQQGYDTELTSTIQLEAAQGGIKNSSGRIEVPTARVRRGSLEMGNIQPLRASIKNGIISIDHFFIQGDNTQLTAESKSSPSTKGSQILLTGSVDMSLLAFLTPFLQEMRGVFSISTQIRIDEERAEILGSAFINKGYIKLKEFPHPLEQLKADFLFSQKKLIINSFSGSLAGGRASADGTIQFVGLKDFPTQINLRLDDVNLKVPAGVSTTGSALLKVTGNWFPFLLSGNYSVQQGLMDRAFQSDEENTVRRSSFLPRIILQETFEPIRLDIDANLVNSFQVKNSLIDTQIAGQVKLKGTPTVPILLGEVRALRGGQIFFRETPFEILTAVVRFDNPIEINPILYVTARARVQALEYTESPATSQSSSASEGTSDRKRFKQYEVNLLLQGPQKTAKINLTSQPPLEEHDIISLLALGVTAQQLERRQSSGQDQVTEIGVGILSQSLKVNSKWLDVRIAPTSGADDTRVGDSKIVVSKQITPKMSTSVSRTVLTNKTDAQVRYQLNDSLSAIFNWEGRQFGEEEKKERTESSSDKFGVGIEYGVEFK
jgi:translocation and assembly module TamB